MGHLVQGEQLMGNTADNSQQDDNQITITVRGRTMTMGKRAGQVIGWTFVLMSSVAGPGISIALMFFFGWELAAVYAVAVIAVGIPYIRRTNRELKARDAAKAVSPLTAQAD